MRSIWPATLLTALWAAGAASQTASRIETWIAPSAETQLYMEGLDDRKGLGRIFVPAMTSPANEPFYAVFQEGELVGERNMGSSFFLEPGRYTVVLGTGTLEQRISREVEVRRGETVIMEPEWCSLTIEVIDETRDYVPQDLQIFRAETGESFGVVPAINPELGEQVQTLVLPAGLYKVVKRGADFNTYINFTTLFLESGSYTPLTIVLDSEGNFTGAGILTAASRLRQRRHWSLYGAVHGSVMFNAANTASVKKVKNNYSLLGQFENRLIYDRFPHYYLSRNLLETGALQQEGARFVVNQDRLQLKNTYIYYLLKWLGGYSRLELSTHLFETWVELDTLRNVTFMGIERDTVKQELSTDRIKTQPVFYPLEFKEGVGVNVTPLRTFIARLTFRAGLGYWQVYNKDVYSRENDTLFVRSKNSFSQGPETSLLASFALLRNLTITHELDLLFPLDPRKKVVMDLENFITLRLSKYVSLEHTLRLKRFPEINYLIQEQFVSLRLSYFLF